jgi:hypothetical protein
MPFVLLALAIVLSILGVDFAQNQTENHTARVIRSNQQALLDAINAQVSVAINAAKAAAINGQISVLPADVNAQAPACGVIDANDAAEADCTEIIKTNIHFTGLTTNAAGQAAPGANGIQGAVGNVDTATTATGTTFESVLAFVVTASIYDPTGTSLAGSRLANGALDIISVCTATNNCAQQTAEVHFDGWRDGAGAHDLAAVEGASGRCNPADPTCSLAGADNHTVDAGVTPSDGRAHLAVACYDPNFVGNGGTNPGDRCNPTGDPAAGNQDGSHFTNPNLTNSSATNGSYAQ